ncbi:hypothetical protein EXO80_22700 [Salmonella enterica]|nr:hypothetical protein [Salmonella enterica]ECH1726052.1 hypothetical protein [Salmonella enterica]
MVQYNKYSTIHSLHAIQIIHTVRTVHTPSLFFTEDPEKGGYGSSILATPSGALSPQHVPPIEWPVLLYVVSDASFVIRRAGARKTALLIRSPWYTSGKSAIAEKSDHPKTCIR